jgi:hypothetical protein
MGSGCGFDGEKRLVWGGCTLLFVNLRVFHRLPTK